MQNKVQLYIHYVLHTQFLISDSMSHEVMNKKNRSDLLLIALFGTNNKNKMYIGEGLVLLSDFDNSDSTIRQSS